MFSQVVTKAIAFLYTLFLAANLGVSDYGLYVAAVSYFSLVSILVDFGVGQYLIREVSVDKDKLSYLLSHAVLLRSLTLSITFMIFALVLGFFDSDSQRVSLVMLAILACLPQAVALSFDSIFVAMQKLSISAIGLLFLSLSSTLSGVLLINNGFGVMGAVVALQIGQFIYALVLILLGIKHRVGFDLKIRLSIIKRIVMESLPYGVLGLLGLLYFKVDSLMLSYMKGSYATGIYGAAYKFLEAITFVPSSISMALFPVLANLAIS